MVYENNAVMWVVNITNPTHNVKTAGPVVTNVSFELGAMLQQYATVGTWVYPVSNDLSQFNFTVGFTSGRKTVSSTSIKSVGGRGTQSKPAAARYVSDGLR